MSYVKSLKDHLRERNTEMFNRLPEIEKQAKNILQYSQAKFPYYTPHGFEHSENVLENLNWLLPEDVKGELNGYELFFLIVAAWLHDWGLIGTPNEDPAEIREKHHIRTEEKFDRHYGLVRVSQNEGRIIGRICKGHRKEDLFNGEFDDTPFEKGIIIHRQFLAAALRIADEIDVTASRVPEIIYFELNPVEKAEEEFKKQMDIIGIAYPSERERYKLALSAIAWDPLAVVAVTKLKEKIQLELNNVKTILATGINHVGMQLDYIDLKVDTRGFLRDSIEFTIDKEKILDLLIGRSLYPRKDVAIRELLQNSIDACRLRKTNEKDYTPEINVSQEGNLVSIEDNGIGMDFTTAKKYLSLVGSSYYSSEEFMKLSTEKQAFDPISRWGLGFLSCFLIALEVTIETKKTDSQACKFVISSIDRGWRYEVGTRKTSGTIISLRLTEESKSLSVLDIIRFYVKRSEIPIYLQKGTIRQQLDFDWSIQTEFEQRLKDERVRQGIMEFGMPALLKNFIWKSENFDACFYTFDKRMGNIFEDSILACIQGIRINLPKSIDRSFSEVLILLDIKKNIVDFDVAREFLIDNQKLRALLREISLVYIRLINEEFKVESKGKGLFDKECTRYKFFHEIAGWSELFRFLTLRDKEDFLLDGVNPIITRKNIIYEKLSTLLDNEPKRLIIFDCTSTVRNNDKYKQTLSKMLTLIQGSLGKDDTVLLFFGPFYYQWENTLMSILEENEIWFKWGELEKYAVNSCEIVKSEIDSLLPSGCHLAKIPKEFDKEIVRRKEFISSKKQYNIKDDMFNWSVASRYGPILFFEDFPVIYEELVKQGIEEQIDGEIPEDFFRKIKTSTKRAEYLLNINNKSVKMLLKNYNKIKNDATSVELAKIMIRSLLLFSQAESLYIDIFAKGLFTEATVLIRDRLQRNV